MSKVTSKIIKKLYDQGFGVFAPTFAGIRFSPLDWSAKLRQITTSVQFGHSAMRIVQYVALLAIEQGGIDINYKRRLIYRMSTEWDVICINSPYSSSFNKIC